MAVSKRLRFEVFRRDNHTCRYCGESAPNVKLTVDHVVPVSLGGSDEPGNLVAACGDCNSGKTSVSPDAPLVDDVEQDALRWSGALKRAAEIQRRKNEELHEAIEDFDTAWTYSWNPIEAHSSHEPESRWSYTDNPDRFYPWVVHYADVRTGEDIGRKLFDTEEDADRCVRLHGSRSVPPRPKDWRKSARSWIAAGLTPADFRLLVEEVISDRDYVEWDRKWAYTAGCCWGAIRERQAVAQALLAAEKEPSKGAK